MKTKLTLQIDEELIDRAKFFAQASGKSVSRLVSDYFSALDANRDNLHDQPTPLVDSLRGVLKDKVSNPEGRLRAHRQGDSAHDQSRPKRPSN